MRGGVTGSTDARRDTFGTTCRTVLTQSRPKVSKLVGQTTSLALVVPQQKTTPARSADVQAGALQASRWASVTNFELIWVLSQKFAVVRSYIAIRDQDALLRCDRGNHGGFQSVGGLARGAISQTITQDAVCDALRANLNP